MSNLVIEPDDPRAPDVFSLLTTHLEFAHAVTAPGHVHALDVDALTGPDIAFYSARDTLRDLLGVGALRHLDDAHGEIKSMHTAARARGRGVGRALVHHLVAEARSRGYARVSLETGSEDAFGPARALYLATGFEVCEPFGNYTVNEYSICMTRHL
jgi:putative acetyltransferase